MSSLRIAAPAEVLAMEPNRHHIISASAGTGKTHAIEHRVVDLIIRGAARIEEILVVTFTEKATAELRLRVRRKIEQLLTADADTAEPGESAWLIDVSVRRQLEEALFSFDRAPIFTIHGFCHRLTSESSFGRGRSLNQTQVTAKAAFGEAFAELMRTELVRDQGVAPLLEAWFRSGRTAAALRAHLFRCRERGGVIEPAIDPARQRAALERLAQAISNDPLAKLNAHPNSARAIERWLAEITPHITSALAATGPAQEIAALTPARASLHKLADKAEGDDLEIFAAAAALDEVALDIDAAITVSMLPRIEASLARAKALRGQFDFSDMLGHVASALTGEGGDALAAELRERYPIALIDEFQDTSELQWLIFREIYLTSVGGALTVVGDPKQAIYAFRGADLHTFRAACAELRAAGAGELVLSTNYRSTPQLVTALTRMTGSEVGEPFFIHTEADAFVTAGRDDRLVDRDDRDAPPVVVGEISGKKLRSDQLAAKVVDFYANEVAKLIAGERGLYLKSTNASPREVLATDIMMLTRSRAESDELADALARRGVPSSTLHNRDLFTTREARELLDLLKAIANPRSSALRSRALATRFFDLALTAVATAASDPDLAPATALLHRWRTRAEKGRLETLLPLVVSESRLALRELALDRGSRTVTNVEHLIELLVADVVRSPCSLSELADRLEARMSLAHDNESADPTPVRAPGDVSAVQIMTIHAAKGLEAPIVFVMGGYGRRSIKSERLHTYHLETGGSPSRRLRIGRPPEALTEVIENERDAEDERLMYVAITRAASRLYTVHIAHSTFAVSGAHAVLNRRLDPFVTAQDAELFERRAVIDEKVPLRLVPAPPAFDPETDELETPEIPSDVETIRESRAGVAVTSYSRLKRTGSSDVAEKIGNDALGVDGSLGRLGGREVGILLHWILERIELAPVATLADASELADVPSANSLIERAMRGFSLSQRHRKKVDDMVFTGLTTPLTLNTAAGEASIGCFRDSVREAREVEFTFPAREAGTSGKGRPARGFVTGFLDVVLESADKLYVVDWKSDALASYEPAALAAHVTSAYQTQIEIYSLALERMLSLLGPNASLGFGGIIYCFLRGARCYGVAPSPAEVESFRTRLLAQEDTWRI